jgi:hypothetical protein
VTEDRLTAHRALGLAGEARDAAGRSAATLTWTLQGAPGSSFPSEKQIAAGPVAQYVPPTGGLVPGTYVLMLVGRDRDGAVVAASARSLTILGGRRRRRHPESAEQQPCYGASAVADPENAPRDDDFDGGRQRERPAARTPLANAVATFSPTSLQKGSVGTR